MSTRRSPTAPRSCRHRGAGAGAASYTAVHRSLLAGFCTTVGVRGEEGDYLGTRGMRFHIFPGSPLRRRKPALGDGRQHRRDLARVRADAWPKSSPCGSSRRRGTSRSASISSPTGTRRASEVVARERVTFLGLTLEREPHRQLRAHRARGVAAHFRARGAGLRPAATSARRGSQANDAAIREAERMEERLRVRDLVQPRGTFRRFLRARAAATGVERRDARALHAAFDGRRAAARSRSSPSRHLRAPSG